MADRMDLMVKLNAELHQFMRDHSAAVSDPYSEPAYQYTAMQRICVLLSLLPMGAEKINVLMDMDNHDTLQSILYFQDKNRHIDKHLETLPFCVERYVDETYKECRRAALTDRLERNCENFNAGLEKLPPRKIIESAGAIHAREDIVFHSGDMTSKLDLIDIEALLTLKNPLEAIYQAWLKQEGRDMGNLDKIAGQEADYRRAYLDHRTGVPEGDDEQLYRENHRDVPDPGPVQHYMERLDDFWGVVDGEFYDLDLDVDDLNKYQKVFNCINSTNIASMGLVNLEALLTFGKPIGEVIRLMNRYHYGPMVSLQVLAAQRLTELSNYMERVESLPDFLQEPVRTFKKQFEQAMAYQIAAPAQEAAEQEDEEFEEDR